MGTISIQFQGICTQIKLPQPVGTTLHRVVMVHGEVGAFINELWIPPHRTFLRIDQANLKAVNLDALHTVPLQPDGSWQLLGTRLFVQNAVGTGITYETSMNSIPSLTELTPDFGPLSTPVVYETDAAAHFDVTTGTFSADQMPGHAWYATLAVETSDQDVILGLQDLAMPADTGTLTIKSGTTIVVMNTGGTLSDTPWDFLLHYLTAETLPADAKYPPNVIPQTGFTYEVLGPGCSNSNFP